MNTENATKNATRMTLTSWATAQGYASVDEALEEHGRDDVMPAMCTEECDVEPDGVCPHGNPSLLMALGII